MFRFLFLVIIFTPLLVHAATCDAGYYLENDVCKICNHLYYCPGDDIRYACTQNIPSEYISNASMVNFNSGKTNADECICSFKIKANNDTQNLIIQYSQCESGPSGPAYNTYTGCNNGYYATGYGVGYNNNLYSGCAPCTNAPTGAVYTGYGTPITENSTEIGNNCTWRCADDYKINEDGTACDKLCTLGFTKLNTSTGISVPLFADKRTTPSINIGDVNGACHADLAPGRATGAINIMYNGAVYHTVSPTATLQCNAGYYLHNDMSCYECGNRYYCPGDNSRYACADLVPADSIPPSSVQALLDKDWNSLDYTHANKPSDCICWWYDLSDERRTTYRSEGLCQNGDAGASAFHYYYNCRTGYYATQPVNNLNRYRDCAACYNGPEHSHYTSYSTPSVMYAVESNCPWECDDGYVRDGDTCVAESQ